MTGLAMFSRWVAVFSAQEAAGQMVPAGGAERLAAGPRLGDYPHLTGLFARSDGPDRVSVDVDAAFRAGIEALLFGIAGSE